MSAPSPFPAMYAVSKYHDLLYQQSQPQDTAYFEHIQQGHPIESRISYNSKKERPWVLSLHGARSDFTKSDPVTLALQQKGYSVLSPTLSGHSPASPVANGQTSLLNNVHEAEALYGYLDPQRPKIVIGYSLGGTPALKLLQKHGNEIEKLILFYPGIYSVKAYEVNYGPAFTRILSESFSYRDNDTIQLLGAFKGKVLLVMGQYDGLDPQAYGRPEGGSVGEFTLDGQTLYSPIPKDVIDMIRSAVLEEQLTSIVIPGCDHLVMRWMRSRPDQAQSLVSQLTAFLQS